MDSKRLVEMIMMMKMEIATQKSDVSPLIALIRPTHSDRALLSEASDTFQALPIFHRMLPRRLSPKKSIFHCNLRLIRTQTVYLRSQPSTELCASYLECVRARFTTLCPCLTYKHFHITIEVVFCANVSDSQKEVDVIVPLAL